MKVYHEILSYLPKDEYVYITGHIHPDGDCVGATMAMYHLLKASGYKPLVFLEYKQAIYSYIDKSDQIIELNYFLEHEQEYLEKEYSMIVMDSGDLTRITPFIKLYEQSNRSLNIDHHASNTFFADKNIVDVYSSSTCEMVGSFLGLHESHEMNDLLTKEVATALYTGIIYDTGVFKHSNTRFETHMISGHLVRTGIDFTEITNRLFFTRSPKSLKAMEIALHNIQTYKNCHITTTILDKKIMNEFDLSKEHTEGIVSMLIEIEDAMASAFLLETKEGEFKVSFRSNSTLDVCAIAKVFGGGGHIKAAGCTISGQKEAVYKKVVKELFEAYEQNKIVERNH